MPAPVQKQSKTQTDKASAPSKRRCPWCDTLVEITVPVCPECGEQLIKVKKEKNTQGSKKKKGAGQTVLGVFLVIIGFFIFIGIVSNSASDNKKLQAKDRPTPELLPVEQSLDIMSTTTDYHIDENQQKLTDIFNAMNIDDSDLQIFIDDQDVWRVIYTDNKTYWDATDGMSHYLSDYVNFCSKAMALEYVDAVQFFIFSKFYNPDDSEVTEKAVVVNVPKSYIMQENNWNRYNLGGLYWFVEDSADVFDVHAALRNELVQEDVKYIAE